MRVFVTADSPNARRLFRVVLENAGHVVFDSDEVGAGALLASSPWTTDAVIAGIFSARPPQQQRSATLVEIGIALGRGTPILLVTGTGIWSPALTGVPKIEASLEDQDTLRWKLELFLQGVDRDLPRQPAGGMALAKRTPPPSGSHTGAFLEQAVVDLIRTSGTALLNDGPSVGAVDRPDLSFYLEGSESELGLILVEVKQFSSNVHASRRLREASEKLSQFVLQTNAALGLIVYEGAQLPSNRRNLKPLVVAMTLDELRFEVQHRPLADVVRRLRNETIHGS